MCTQFDQDLPHSSSTADQVALLSFLLVKRVLFHHLIPNIVPPIFNLSRGLISRSNCKHLCGCAGPLKLSMMVLFQTLNQFSLQSGPGLTSRNGTICCIIVEVMAIDSPFGFSVAALWSRLPVQNYMWPLSTSH